MSRQISIDVDRLEGLSVNARLLYLHLCTVAGWGDHKVWGVTVGAGQYLTTAENLATLLDWSEARVRRCLGELIGRGLIVKSAVRVSKPPRQWGTLVTLTPGSTLATTSPTTLVTTSNAKEVNKLGGSQKTSLNTSVTTSPTTLVTTSLTTSPTTLVTTSNAKEVNKLGGTQKNSLTTSVTTSPTDTQLILNNRDCSSRSACEDELASLLADENARYVIEKQAGDLTDVQSYFREFAAQQALAGKVEHGKALALHFGYWLAIKRRAEQKAMKNGDLQQQKAERMRSDLAAVAAYGRNGRLPGSGA